MENIVFHVERKLFSIFSGDNIRFINELRGDYGSRIFYNKGLILINEFFKFLSFFSPKLYSGSGVLIILFPIWIIAVLKVIKERRLSILVLLGFWGTIAFLVDQRSLSYLFPIGLVYLYLVCEVIYSLLRRS